MAAKGNSYSNSLLQLIFNATSITGLAINATSSPVTNLYVSLHTASPGAAGNQSSNEASYTSYARQPVQRTSSGWTVTTTSVDPVANITFPTATGGSETETYVGVGTLITGNGVLLYFGPLNPTIPVSSGITPVLGVGSIISES
jgi:hypothetical protein